MSWWLGRRLHEAYDKAIALKPDYTNAFNNRGNALLSLNQLDEALVSYDKALAITADYESALSGVAYCVMNSWPPRQRCARNAGMRLVQTLACCLFPRALSPWRHPPALRPQNSSTSI
jgi:tetratricopeptide (TPR) repeat protein